MWHMIADDLASKFTVVAADLRGKKFTHRFNHTSLYNQEASGYGDSSKPRGSESHIEYSKKEMAADQVGLMYAFSGKSCRFLSGKFNISFCYRQSIGFSEFFIVAHDRGARVAHRLAVDYPSTVKKMMLLDICPTLMMYEMTDMKFVKTMLFRASYVLLNLRLQTGCRILALVLQYYPVSSPGEVTSNFRTDVINAKYLT